MERETSGFDRWLLTVDCVTHKLSLVTALEAVSRLVEEAFGTHLWFAELLGRRWSYVAGRMGDQPAQSTVRRIRLSGKFGMVSDTWGTIAESERVKLIAFLKKLVTSRDGHDDRAWRNRAPLGKRR